MNNRLSLHEELKSVIGNNHVYFQPPDNIRMVYPCIVYSKLHVDTKYADNIAYHSMKSYEVTFITRDPDNDYVEQMLSNFKYCRYDRQFINDNLYHDVFTLYY